MNAELHILLIMPESIDIGPVSRHLAETGLAVTVQQVDTAVALQTALADPQWQAIIAQMPHPSLPPTAVLDMLQAAERELPLLVVDTQPRLETAVSLLKAGASDYLTPDDLPRLGTAVPQAIAVAQTRAAQEQNRLDTAVRAYEQRMHTLLAAMHDLVVIVDGDGRFLDIIPTTPETLYVPREEALGQKITDIFPPDKAALFTEQLRLALANQSPVETEYSLPLPGRETWFKARLSLLPDKTVLFVISDITAAKQAEADIQHEKALSDSLINNLPGVFYLFNEQGQFLRWNENFEKISGYAAAEFSQMHPLDFFDGPDKELIQARIGEVFQTGKSDAEANLITKDGRRLPHYFTGTLIRYNNAPCLIGMGIDMSERRQAEKSLLELKQAVDASGDVIFLTDRDGVITTINAQFTYLYGYTAAEVIDKTTPRILNSGQQELAVYERFWQLITNGHVFRGGIINKTRDGRLVTIEETVNPFRDNEGNITGFLAIQRDVTTQRETERALQETRDFLEMALAQSPSGILIATAPDVTIQMANPAAFHIRGGDPKLLTGIDMTQHAIHWQTYRPNGDPYPPHELPLSRAILHGERVQDEIAIIRDEAGNDHWVSVNAAPIRNPQGEIFAGIVIFHDITERKQAEDELRRQGAALSSAANAIIITNIDGIIEWANPAYTRLTGYEAEEVIGRHTRILKSGKQAPAFYQQLWDTVLAGEVWQGELVNRRKDGTLYCEEQTLTPLRNENGVITHFIAIKQDVTGRKQAESEIRRHLAELQALYVNSIAINRLLDPGAIGEHLIETLAQHLDWRHVTVRLRRGEEDMELIAFNQTGVADTTRSQVKAHFDSLIHKVGQGLSGWTVQTGIPLRTGDVQAYPPYIETFPGIRSGMYVPLLIGERVMGCISVESERPDAFTENDERLLTILASQAAVAFENASLYQAMQHELEERRQAELALQRQYDELQASRQEADFLANLLERSSQPLGVGFTDGRLGLVNAAFCRLVGYSKEELQTMDWTAELTPLEWYESEQQYLQKLQQDDQPVRYEKEYVHKDGRYIPVELFVHLMRSEWGEVAYYYGFITDITERKQHEREQEAIIAVSTALRAATARAEMLPLILEQLGVLLPADGMALVMVNLADGSTTVEAARGAFASTLGSHRPAGEGMSQRVIASGQLFVTTDIHQERDVSRPELFRQVRAVVCVPLLAQRQVIGAIWAGRQQAFTASEVRLLTAVSDIAANAIQRATLHEQTRKQADQITQIMQSVPDGVLLLDARHQILLANPPARACLALLAGVQVGDRLTRLSDQPLEALLTSPPAGSWHELVQDEQVFETVARPLIDGPTPTGWVLVLRDVTERRLVQRQLYEQERLAAIGQLAAGIAHDFNNLLAVITLHTDLVLRTSDLNERNQGRLATVQQQVDYAAHMVKQILDFSRRSNLERQPLDLVSLLNKQVELFRRTLPEHVEVEWVCEPDEIVVEADATRIQQIIMNLAVNARDALPAGGRFTLELSSLELQPRQEPPAVGMAPGRWARLRATDTGAGIAPEHLDRIFEPFFTTKKPGKGTGLGLAQVYGIVAQHGGHITVSSRVGVGTTFTIYLPLLTMTMETAVISSAVDPHPHGHGELVLIVEDNEALRALLLEYLQMWQYRVLEAANSEEALARLAEYSLEVALILSDVVMPRLGGVELFQAVRQRSRRIPFILMSGHSLAEEEITALQREGLYGWLPKPLDMYHLAHLIAAAAAS